MDDDLMELSSRCRIASGEKNDRFVGIRVEDGEFEVVFPIGYSFPNDQRELRNDIRLLVQSILEARSSSLSGQAFLTDDSAADLASAPVKDFEFLIKDFLAGGRPYSESRQVFSVSGNGPISWNRTIAKLQPVVTPDDSIVYLDYVRRSLSSRVDSRLRALHEYCVWVSFCKLGWLYTSYLPVAPDMITPRSSDMFLIKSCLVNTYNDRARAVLNAIYGVLTYAVNSVGAGFLFGTERYEYVWEYMVDRAFGLAEKTAYFPRTHWYSTGERYRNSAIRPDSVMRVGDELFILDAKYYRYGESGCVRDLPGTESIIKQVAYGQAAHLKVETGVVPFSNRVFNAFLLPGRLKCSCSPDIEECLEFVGIASVDWIRFPESFEVVAAFCLDTRFLLRRYNHIGEKERSSLAKSIRLAVESGVQI